MENKGEALKQRAYRELKEFLMLALYLWLFLGMFILFKSIVLAENRIDFAAHGVALVNALVLAKFMLIVRAFHPAKRAENMPLIYPTLLKSAIFAVALMILKVLEDAIVGYFHRKSFTQSIADLGGGSWKAIVIFTAILFLVLTPLTAFGELQRVLGEGRLNDLFLRPRDLSGSK
jgi:uncharacterized membrane protein